MGDAGSDPKKDQSDGKRDKPDGQWRADLIKAIDHPLRRRMLRLLNEREEPLSSMQMADELGISLSITAYHVRILHELRAVVRAGKRQVRGALQRFYKSKVKADPPIETLLEETREVDEGKGGAAKGK